MELLRLVVARDALRVALRVVARRLLDLLIVLRDPLRVPAIQAVKGGVRARGGAGGTRGEEGPYCAENSRLSCAICL